MRQNAKSTVISQGDAKIISSADIVEMQRRQAAKAGAKKFKMDAKKAKADAKKAKAAAKEAEFNVKRAKVSTKREKKVEPIISTHGPGIQAQQVTVGFSAPYPGRAPVVRMW